MGNIKQINIKNRTYYFFNVMVSIEDFDSKLLNIDKRLYKNIDIYYFGYITIKNVNDYENIYIANSLYLTIDETDRYTEGKNGNKYLILLTKYTELWNKIKYPIKTINGGKAGEF